MTKPLTLAKNPYISIIVPALNEEGSLVELVERIDYTLKNEGVTYEIILIDDRSTDATKDVATSLSRDYPLRYFLKKGVRGKAESINEGLDYAKGEILSFIDADLQYPPEKIPDMLVSIKEGFDVVIGERKEQEVSLLRQVPSRLFKFLFLRLLHGLSYDVQSGLKVFRRGCIENVSLESSGWSFDLEFLLRVREQGAKITSIPIIFGAREAGESKISLISASYEIGKNAVQMKLQNPGPQQIKPEDSQSRIGAGFIHHGKTFVSHSLLPAATSAIETFTFKQKTLIAVALLVISTGLFFAPVGTTIAILAVLSAIYFIDTIFSLFLVYKSLRYNPELKFTSEEIEAITDEELPVYSILCPLYKEKDVLPYFLKAMESFDYPKEKLDILLLLEENDEETIETAEKLKMPSYVRTIIVPDSMPKTKPKACNYGLAFVKGDIVVIYDAEDVPDTAQLKKAYLAFKRVPENVVCLQAKLNYFNSRQNILTRLFTAEYSLWFDVMLPGLQSLNTYIPLGGTSNHFKTSVLRELHGWDPFNVTEDCDLGVRLFSKQYRTAIIDSVTLEEANSRVGNWIRQRSRWIKGYMQTYLVYMRHPVAFFRENGIHAVLFQLVVGFKIVFGLINPFLWGTTITYFSARLIIGPVIEELYPAPIFIVAVFSGVFGNFLFFYYYMIGCVKRGHWSIIKFVYLMPFYWLITSIAAYVAFYQLLIKPHYWEKTTHGLHLKKRGLSEFFGFIKRFGGALGNGVVALNPLRLPKYAYSLTHSAARMFGSSEIEIGVDIDVITPPIERRGMGEWFQARLIRMERYLPESLSADTIMKSGVLVAGMMGSNVINLLFNTYLGRTLSFETFGLITFINTMWFVLIIFYNPIVATMDHVTATAFAAGRAGKASMFLFRMLKNVLRIAFVMTIVWFAAIPFIADFFLVSDTWALLSFTPLIIFGIIDSVNKGYIRGSLQFPVLAMLFLLESSVKFLTAFVLVSLGYGENAYVALSAGIVVSALVALWLLRSENDFTVKTVTTTFPKKFYSASLLAGASALLFLSVDILFVKHYLSPQSAGEYALLALVGKMMFFLASFPTSFMITFVSREEGLQNNTKGIFRLLFSVSVVLAVTGFALLAAFGDVIIPFIFGSKAISIVSYIPMYAAGIALFTLIYSIVTYHLAKKEYIFSIISIALSGIISAGIILHHASIGEIVTVITATSVFGFITVVVMHLFIGTKNVATGMFDTLRIPGQHVVTASPEEKQKRILLFNWRDSKHIYAGGAETYVHEMARRWVIEGYDVTVFCGNDGRNPRYETIDGVSIIRRGGFYTVYLWAPFYYLFVMRPGFDIVIDCQNGIPFFTPLYRRGTTYCLLHHVHQDVFTRSLAWPLAQFARFLENRVMPLVYRWTPFITISDSSKKAMQQIGLGKKGITVIHPGVNLAQLKPGAKASHPLVVYVGRLKAYKSIDILINAFVEVLQRVPEAKLVIAGTGEEEDALRELVKKLGVTKSVSFAGKISEEKKIQLLQQAWVAVNPSFMEGWGITTIEANACGTPVVASNVPGLRDSVRNKHTGFLVPYGDAHACSEKILSLLTDKQLRMKLESESLAWAQFFDWQITSNQFLQKIEPKKRYA